jgi:hypothetical protein
MGMGVVVIERVSPIPSSYEAEVGDGFPETVESIGCPF